MRVEVVPVSTEQAVTLRDEPERFAERFGPALVDGYTAFPEALEHLAAALASGIDPAWFAHLIVDTDADEVIGLGGFSGPPTDGEVEIGYSVAPACRGRGVASAAVARWLELARAGGARRVCAHTSPEENASTAVLRRHGFVRDGEATDPDEGVVWRWRLDLAGS